MSAGFNFGEAIAVDSEVNPVAVVWDPSTPLIIFNEEVVVMGSRPRDLRGDDLEAIRAMTMLSWRTLLPAPENRFAPTPEDIRQRVATRLPWKWTITTIARLLAEPVRRIEDQRHLTRQALLDDWPATILAADIVADALTQGASPRVAVPAAALNLILVDALRAPWSDEVADEPPDEIKLRILCRAAMTAIDFIANTAPEIDVPARRETYYNAELLLPLLRQSTRESSHAFIARAHELYCELLVASDPQWCAHALDLEDRIADLCVLSQAITDGCDSGFSPWFDPVPNAEQLGGKKLERLIRVLDSVSMDRAGFERALSEPTAPIPLDVLSRTPVLRDRGQYLFLDRHLLLRAADEQLLPHLKRFDKDLPSKFGKAALEPYVRRMLERSCEGIANSRVLRIPDEQERREARLPSSGHAGRKRCDFAVLLGETLVVVDSKLLMPSMASLSGVPGLRAFMDRHLPTAMDQMLQTAEDIRELGLHAVVPDSAPGTKVDGAQAWIVSYLPLCLWFSDAEVLLQRTGIAERWGHEFCAPPSFLSLQDLGYMEANPGTIEQFATARRLSDARASSDVEGFLASALGAGWPSCSARVMRYVSSVFAAQDARD